MPPSLRLDFSGLRLVVAFETRDFSELAVQEPRKLPGREIPRFLCACCTPSRPRPRLPLPLKPARGALGLPLSEPRPTRFPLASQQPTMSTLTTATSAFVTGRRVTSGARATTATRLVRPAPARGPCRVLAMGFGDRKKKVPKVDENLSGAVGGAVLGGLLLGPFGAIIGGNMGANFGAGKKAARMEDEALRKQGISKEMVQMVTEVAQSLANAEDALKTAKESLKFELEDALSLEAEANELYNMASAAVQSGDDDTARKHLTERKRVEAKMEDAKRRAAEAKGRVQRVEQSVESLASQAKKLESVLKENMANAAELNAREAAAKFQDAMAPSVTELELDDPLERKFRELEGR